MSDVIIVEGTEAGEVTDSCTTGQIIPNKIAEIMTEIIREMKREGKILRKKRAKDLLSNCTFPGERDKMENQLHYNRYR